MATSTSSRLRFSAGSEFLPYWQAAPITPSSAAPAIARRAAGLSHGTTGRSGAPLLRFWSLQRLRLVLRCPRAPLAGLSRFGVPATLAVFRLAACPCLRPRLLPPASSRRRSGLLRRWPVRSFVAGFFTSDVPDPPPPVARPCRDDASRQRSWDLALRSVAPAGRLRFVSESLNPPAVS